ncbi:MULTISPECIES: hypothetical protein [Streptomyces violaceusniger group]|uniref:Carbohydrate kinase PfkB domain-containing protein n=2 Tax=Streptomyces javensis TaxID=114698 RepID=A0ABN1X2H2_9ACTN|nr:hypothetical protein [Streptomyces javensis]MBI0311972.1 hypothetical protein [Streptomyces javensis]
MSTRTTVVGSIDMNEAIRPDQLPSPGETIGAHSSMTAPRKGAHPAIAAVRTGVSVRMAGAVEAANGAVLRDFLARDGMGIATSARLEEDTSSGRAVVFIDEATGNRIMVAPDANHAIPGTDVERTCAARRPGGIVADLDLLVVDEHDHAALTALPDIPHQDPQIPSR